jgi:hypothetical protein
MNIQRLSQETDTTPPASFANIPLTPPLTAEKATSLIPGIIEEIGKRRAGHNPSSDPWLTYEIDAAEYRNLKQLLGEGFAKHKLRYHNHIVPIDPTMNANSEA